MFLFEKELSQGKIDTFPPTLVNLSRRDFIKFGVLAAGSTFVLGLFSGCESKEKVVLSQKVAAQGNMGDAQFQPNLLIGLNDKGDVFIVCTRSEMGQGIRTGMPQVIADEMAADWLRVHVVQADGDPKYGNQNTDGSRSVRNHFEEWRLAGATAKAMLLTAAAQNWGVPTSECQAENHRIIHAASQREIGFGKLATIAATLDVPEDPPLKSRDQWQYIGKPLRGVDNRDITTGKAVFGIDATVPGMKYAAIRRCPVIGGTIKNFDDSAALQVPGVLQVVQLTAMTAPPAYKALGGLAVVAENTWAAFKGCEALTVEWDWGENEIYNSDNYRTIMGESATSPGREVRSAGDTESALAGSAKTVEATYYLPMLAHSPMEPPNALAWVKDDGSCEIWAPTQAPQSARGSVAGALGIEVDKVTVHVTLLGGGFGRKSKADFVVEAALVSRAVGAPVKLTWSREDEIRFDYFHAPSVQYLKAGLNDDGSANSWLHRTVFPSIGSTFSNGVTHASSGELGLGITTLPYDIPNIRLENGAAKAHVRIGWLRSVCNIYHAFAVNAFAGEMAYAAGQDQKDYLLKLIGEPRNLNHLLGGERGAYGEDLNKQPYESGRLSKVIEVAAEKAGWGKQLPEGQAMGIAAHFSFVAYVANVIEIAIVDNKVEIKKVHTVIDCGTYVNEDRVKAQMEGAVVFGLSLALHGNITAKAGAIEQSNFHDAPLLRLSEMPPVEVHLIDSNLPPGGVGEPGVPPVAPALTNAILLATGKPIRELPIRLG